MTDLHIDQRLPERVEAEATEASRALMRIRSAGRGAATDVDSLKAAIWDAKRSGAAKTLGFKTWVEFLNAALQGCIDGPLENDPRNAIIAILSREGMSTRSVGAFLNISHATVAREVDYLESGGPETETETGATRGLQRKKVALTRTFFESTVLLRRATDRIRRNMDDPRFAGNAQQISNSNRAVIEQAVNTLTELLRELPNTEGTTTS